MHLQYLLIVAQRVRLGFQPSPPMAKYKNLSARSDTVDVKSIPEGSPKALTKSPAASGVEASRGSLLCTHPQRAPAHNTLLYSTPLTKHNGEQRHHDACVCGNGMRRRVWLPMTADNQWLTHSATHQHRKLQLDPAGLAARPYDPPCCVQRTRARQTWVCGAGTPMGTCAAPTCAVFPWPLPSTSTNAPKQLPVRQGGLSLRLRGAFRLHRGRLHSLVRAGAILHRGGHHDHR
jgi:hypothetical protein